MAVMCKHYKARDITAKQNCPNCHRWVGIECVNHVIMVTEQRAAGRTDRTAWMMKTNKPVYLD